MDNTVESGIVQAVRVLLYARYSSDNQREESIDAQLRACREYCRSKGYAVVGVYTDEARTATTDERPGFLRMMEDIRSGAVKVRAIVVHKGDRFARNKFDSVVYKRELRKRGVRVESVLERWDDSPEGRLMEGVLEDFAQYFSENLARETMKGLRENAYKARSCGGVPPLGYGFDADNRYVLNEGEAVVVRTIFNLYDRGLGYERIVQELNSRGFLTRRGRPFCKNSLRQILENEKYTGVFVYNKGYTKTPEGKRTSRTPKPADQVIRVPGGIPRIVEQEVWDRVQARIANRRRHSERARNRAKVVYILSGLVRCGVCGGAYVGNSRSGGGYSYHYYECGRRGRSGDCPGRRVKKEDLEAAVLAELEESVFSPAGRARLTAMVRDSAGTYAKERQDEMRYLRNKLNGIRQSMDNILAAVEKGVATGVLLEQLERRQAEAGMINSRLRELEGREYRDWTEDEIRIYLDAKLVELKTGSEETLRSLAQEFISQVTVFDDRITVEGILGTGGGPKAFWSATRKLPPQKGRGRLPGVCRSDAGNGVTGAS